MRKLSFAVFLVLVSSTVSAAQSVEPLALVDPARPVAETRGETKRAADKKFWIVAAGLNTAMLLDTKSTFDVTRWCPNCEEANPFVRPFVERGPAVTFSAGVAFDAGVMALAATMKRSERTWLRRTWWVVPAALVTGHTIAWRHNVNLGR